MVKEEELRLGNYRLVRLLGRGGFADVFLGEHIYLKTSAAIKVLRMHLSDEALTEFLAEARLIARLTHPHIVSVHDFGIEKSLPFLVMTYAPHGTIRERYPEGSVLSPALVANFVRQIAEGLQYAHERKVVHRDVKPENILIGEDEQLMLSDFGIAVPSQSMPGEFGVGNAASARVIGTATYMPPEQVAGRPGYTGDQYSLAVIAYEWLCGRPPFVGETYMEVVRQHIYVPPPPFQDKSPLVTPALEQVVLRALSKDPQNRFPQVLEFAQALEKAVAIRSSRRLGISSAGNDVPAARMGLLPSVTPTTLPAPFTNASMLPPTPRGGLLSSSMAGLPVAKEGLPSASLTGLPPVTGQSYATGLPPVSDRPLPALSGQPPVSSTPVSNLSIIPDRPSMPATPMANLPAIPEQPHAAGPQLPASGGLLSGAPSRFPIAHEQPFYSSETQSIEKKEIVAPDRSRTPGLVPGRLSLSQRVPITRESPAMRFYSQRLASVTSASSKQAAIPATKPGAGMLYPPEPPRPQSISRRAVLLGLGAVAVAGVMGVVGVKAWQNVSQGQKAVTSLVSHPHAQPTARPTVAPAPTQPPATPTPAPNPVLLSSSRPALASTGPGLLDLFVRGTDGAIWQCSYDGTWHEWQSILSGVSYDPAVVSWGAGRLDLFVRGADNTLQHAWYDGVWHAWENLSGSLSSDPTVSSWGANRLDVFARGTDLSLYHIAYDGSWHAWEGLGGGLTSSPAAASWGQNTIDVFARGNDNALWNLHYAGSWQSWSSLGNTLTSEPAVVSWGANRLDVFARGTDMALDHIAYDGSWHPWESLLKPLTTAPTANSWGSGLLEVTYRTTGNVFQSVIYSANTWQYGNAIPLS